MHDTYILAEVIRRRTDVRCDSRAGRTDTAVELIDHPPNTAYCHLREVLLETEVLVPI